MFRHLPADLFIYIFAVNQIYNYLPAPAGLEGVELTASKRMHVVRRQCFCLLQRLWEYPMGMCIDIALAGSIQLMQ